MEKKVYPSTGGWFRLEAYSIKMYSHIKAISIAKGTNSVAKWTNSMA